MTEFATIKVEKFRDLDGAPTCCLHFRDAQCQFLGARNLGTIEVCVLTGSELHRFGYVPGSTEWAAEGWLRPETGCPVWPAEATA